MLEIKKITKIYETEGFKQKALDGVSVNFRESEFASILGPSGSGKTTFLNIIGGLDKYTSGDLIINGTSTKEFKDSDWDSYRNHRIGFVFQSYNLISHQTILSNVKLALTLSGISKKEATARAKKALKDVGLEKHINKRPNQLSGGQMQRVAIARALVNDPDILLADEPTGALDSETSVQIMDLLKEISKNKLVVMVTHNPELAEKYSNRIIKLKDGKITSDSHPFEDNDVQKESLETKRNKSKKINMSYLTSLSLSFNNLMTKKGRTILVAFAGSIGIIGIALILAVSTGFQNYVDSIQEETLTSYPLTIMQEATDITGILLSMTSGDKTNNHENKVVEKQVITSMLGNVKSNDLKSFKKYVNDNYDEISKDISTIKYSYNVDPLIYTHDATGSLAKLNPNNLFTSMYGSSMMSSYSSLASTYTQLIDNTDIINEQYDILAGHLPEKYNEMVLVLSEPNSIPDLLVYSLGFRDMSELQEMVTKIMSGESAEINNEPLTITYDEILNKELKLIMKTDTYKYNKKYDIYEDMSEDEDYMENLYNKSENLKIVGIICPKEGSTSSAVSTGIAYTSSLVDYIINYSSKTDIVKKQLENDEIDVFSGSRFDSKTNGLDLDFSNIVTVDEKKLQSAFNIKINQNEVSSKTKEYISDISSSITVDSTPAREAFTNTLETIIDGFFKSNTKPISLNDTETLINAYMSSKEVTNLLSTLEKDYVVPSESFKTAYSSLLTGLVQTYISSYATMDQSLTTDPQNPTAVVIDDVLTPIKENYLENAVIISTEDTMSNIMTEAKIKKEVLTKVGKLSEYLTTTFSNAFSIDSNKIASAFKVNFSEEELTRMVKAMYNNTESNATSNLASLDYQDKDNPTFISFYFTSFDNKEHFMNFIEEYNDKMEAKDMEDKVINYTDTTGILMDSVKTIVNAVSYVLIAFVSISLVVSSIMIGIITYISVFERTKEIGILRSIGASKRNISEIFNAETFIIGFLSGMIGIGVSYSLIPIINAILHHYIGDIPLKVTLNINHALILVVLSIVLTLIGGLIPAKSASRKDPVEALRSE